MRFRSRARVSRVVAITSLALLSCGRATLEQPVGESSGASATSSFDRSLICESLAERFLGLPTASPLPWRDVSPTPVPSAGRWWVRHCSARTMGAELLVQVTGPGWYWLDEVQNGIRVTQQVPFELDLSLRGRFQGGIEKGVVSLQFHPSVEPVARLRSPAELETHSVNAWGALLQAVLGVSPARRAAERFHQEFSQALLAHLSGGATFTYAIGPGQPDATLGYLLPGETPKRPFQESVWTVNDRILLGPNAVQVLGPIKPGTRRLNVIVERGPGVGYRLICEAALRGQFPSHPRR